MTPFGVRQFRRMLAGCVAINVVMFVLSTMGSVLAGNFLGEKALTGVALASPLFTFCSFLTSLIGSGMGINYSLRRGGLDRDGAEAVFMQGVWTALSCGVLLGLGVWIFRDAFIGLMTADAEVMRNAVEYWRWLPYGLALNCFWCVLCNCCYCDGDTLFATVVICAQGLISLGASAMALRSGFGSDACSLGFFAGYLFSCVVLAFHFVRRCNTFSFRWRFDIRETWIIFRTSIGDATGFLGDALVYVFLGYVLSRSFGETALIGLPVFVFVMESLSFVNGFSVAMQPIVAVYFGENNHRSIRKTMVSIGGLLFVVCMSYSVILAVFPGIVLSALGITDPAAEPIVRVLSLMILPNSLMNVFNNYLQLIEREVMAVWLTVFYWVALPAALLFSFPVFWSGGFWYWAPVSRWTGLVLFSVFLLWRFGRRRFPLLLDRAREASIFTFDLGLRELEIALVAEAVSRKMLDHGIVRESALRCRLLVEESLMVIKERNGDKPVHAEVILDLNDGVVLTLRDDGVIFDITDADARVSGLRTYLVATMMQRQSEKSNILTTGFNRNVFRL